MFFIKALKDGAWGVDLPPDKDITNGNLKLNDMKCFESQKYRQPNHPRPQTPRTLPGNRKILYTTLISLQMMKISRFYNHKCLIQVHLSAVSGILPQSTSGKNAA